MEENLKGYKQTKFRHDEGCMLEFRWHICRGTNENNRLLSRLRAEMLWWRPWWWWLWWWWWESMPIPTISYTLPSCLVLQTSTLWPSVGLCSCWVNCRVVVYERAPCYRRGAPCLYHIWHHYTYLTSKRLLGRGAVSNPSLVDIIPHPKTC